MSSSKQIHFQADPRPYINDYHNLNHLPVSLPNSNIVGSGHQQQALAWL